MSVCTLSFLPNDELSNLSIVTDFSSKYFSGNTSLPIKNSFLVGFFNDQAESLAVFLSNL